MSDRERNRERPSGGHHQQTPSVGFIANLFGRRQPTTATSRQANESFNRSSVAGDGSLSSGNGRTSSDLKGDIGSSSPKTRFKTLHDDHIDLDIDGNPGHGGLGGSGGLGGAGLSGGNGRGTASPSPIGQVNFDLQRAMILMDDKPETMSKAELNEIIKATSQYLANLLLSQDNLDSSSIITSETNLTNNQQQILPTAKEVKHLYRQAIRLSNPRGPKSTRVAAKRLLAALVAIAPPASSGSVAFGGVGGNGNGNGSSGGIVSVDLPDPINVVSLYKVITSSATPSTSGGVGNNGNGIGYTPSIDEIYVEIGALKELTKNGTEVDGTEGIVGWLVRTLGDLTDEWIRWCEKKEEEVEWDERRRTTPFAPIKPATPAEAASVIIDLIAAIISSHASLFSYNDLRRILTPVFALFWRGALAELKSTSGPLLENMFTHAPQMMSNRRESPSSSIHNSPAAPSSHALGMEPALRRSISLKRSPIGSISSISTPSKSTATSRQVSMSDSIKSPSLTPTVTGSIPPPNPGLNASQTLNHRTPSPQPPTAAVYFKPKWSRLMPSFTSFFEILTKSVTIPTEVFREAVAVACLVLGQESDDLIANEVDTSASELISLVLTQEAGRRGENAIRMVLEGTAAEELGISALKEMVIDRCATRGAVIASHTLLGYIDHSSAAAELPAVCAMASLTPSLRLAESTSRFGKESFGSKHDDWESVDCAILGLLQKHLITIADHKSSEGRLMGDAWAEGQAACEILDGLAPLILADPFCKLRDLRPSALSPTIGESEQVYSKILNQNTPEGKPPGLLPTLFEAVIHLLPKSIAQLHSSTSQSPEFYHPKYIDLMLSLGKDLDTTDANVVVDYYERECLCLPFTSGWTDNIWKLLRTFFWPLNPSSTGPSGNTSLIFATGVELRKRITKLLFDDVYDFVHDLPEYRVELIDKVFVPFLNDYLPEQEDEEFQTKALGVLVRAVVQETFERDDERRLFRASKAKSENEEEDASAQASQQVTDATFSGSFNMIRGLIAEIAHLPCKQDLTTNTGVQASGVNAGNTSTPSHSSNTLSRSTSVKGKESSLRSSRGAISPPSRTTDLPSISSITSPNGLEDPSPTTSTSPIPAVPAHSESHANCRSIQAVTSLIAIFTRLCFTPYYHNTQGTSMIRMPASFRSIIVFRDLLGLLYPMTDDRMRHKNTPTQVKIAARCPKARMVILEWLMRLRADKHHRLYIRDKIDEAAMPFAAMLRRTRETEAEGRAAEAAEETRRRARTSQANRQPIIQEENDRGRSTRVPQSAQEPSNRSRSRSKAPMSTPIVRGVDHTYNPLWILPQECLFELPNQEMTSEIMQVYNPAHPALKNPDNPPVDGVWLPVSQYVRVLNGILRGHDWELVSYVLCFLPLQLRNKLFFHGKRAVVEVRALLRVLTEGVLGTEGNWEKRYNVPTFIKRLDINAIAYQSLSILIAYRGTLHANECDQLIQAFVEGLQARKELATPCLQALTLCIYELEKIMGRHLLIIIERMERIVTTTALAIYVLEFLIVLGHHGSMYRNFTDEQYRRVFHVAIDYIAIHNERADQPIDLSQNREDYTLSQHVIGLAYYSIYLWFLALKLPQRPNLVPEITKKLLQSRSKRVIVDEMAEVCFDWLARYTYGNADPKPASSFLNDVVMKDARETENPKSMSWLLGGGIVTVTSHQRSGWATISNTRPTGTTAIICKLENVPLLELGESNADLVSLPAFLMANRGEIVKGGDISELERPEELATTKSTVSSPEGFDAGAQHGYIWSGATPSQRRKDVVVTPNYLGLLLLSSYPNQSLDTPRGRLIPTDERFQRTMRGITNTPVIDTVKIAVLYCGPGQTTETEILGNIDGSPLYLDFLSGLGRLIKLRGQVDVFVGGLNRDNDSDGEYAYAWWDDFDQIIFHTPTMMPNNPNNPNYENKKRLVGNDYVKIVYNESGKEFEFNTIRTAWNFINIVISPLTLGETSILSLGPEGNVSVNEKNIVNLEDGTWTDWDREEWFKVEIQKLPGIPEFGPLGEGKLVSRHALPILVRQLAQGANDMAARFMHIRDASDAASAEYITSWRSRLRAISRLRDSLPPTQLPTQGDEKEKETAIEEIKRDFTRAFSHRNTDQSASKAGKSENS